MRKLTSLFILALGALAGLIPTMQDGWGTRSVMLGVGVLFAAPFAGAVFFFGRKASGTKNTSATYPTVPAGDGVSSDELAANYWRDKGYPPMMKPPEGHPDTHQFDPDRTA